MVPPKCDVDAEGRSLRRRSLLRAGATALAAASVAGCLGATGDTGADPTTDETTGDATADHAARVAVGPDGELRFAAETLVVPPGTKVTWVWESDTHNIAVRKQPDGANWQGTEGGAGDVYDTGHEYSHTFETTGTYEYVCVPHETVGMKGTIVVSESVDEPTTRESETTEPETETATADDLPVKVGPGGRLTFEPGTRSTLVVDPGTTVRFVWGSDNHNIAVHDQPEDANWEGTPGDYDDTYDEGYEYSHTFEVEGRYEFLCVPHERAGMVGTIVVGSPDATTEEATSSEPATADDLPVRVGPDEQLKFTPGTDRPLTVPAGTEVGFVWESDQHNVVVESQPDGANWAGTPGDPDTVYDEGYEYGHTFDVPGTYEFFCQAHRSAGMVGTIVVEEE